MTHDDRSISGLIFDILDALERHGHVPGDDQHAGRAIGLIGDLARIYEGSQDYPAGAHLIKIPSSLSAQAEHPGQDRHDAVTLTGADVSTAVAALDIAADYKRDRAEVCADCADQSCPTCQSRHRDAQAYDHLAAQILQTAQARAASRGQPEPGSPTPSPGQADRGLEAGQ
jgi:hypothetical protein